MTRNAFTTAAQLDAAVPDTYLAPRPVLTLWIFGPAAHCGELTDTLNDGDETDPSSTLSRLATARRPTIDQASAPARQALFHLPMPPAADSLVEFAGELAGELIARWPSLTVVASATPHRRHRSHQVLVIHQERWVYTERPATHNDTLIGVCADEYPVGILRDGTWLAAEQDEEFDDLAAICERHVHDLHSGDQDAAAFLVLLNGEPRRGDLQDAGLQAHDAGLGLLWVLNSDYRPAATASGRPPEQ